MKILFILISFLAITITGYCQTKSDTISIIKKGRFVKNEEFLNTNQLLILMRGNDEALELMKKAKSNSAFAAVLSFAGGVLIGLPIGSAIGGGEPNWGMVAVGGGLIILSIPLINSYRNKSTQAVEIFNKGILEANHGKPELYLQTGAHGIGLTLRF